jgi:hypothetical protein
MPTLLPYLLNFALEYSIRDVKKDEEVLELNVITHQLFVYADNINILDEYIYTIKNEMWQSLSTCGQLQ